MPRLIHRQGFPAGPGWERTGQAVSQATSALIPCNDAHPHPVFFFTHGT